MPKEIIIAPLAICHTYTIKKSKEAFEQLAKKEPVSFSCCAPSFFREPLISAWVNMQYIRLGLPGGLIEQYKMGKLLRKENKQNAINTFSLEPIADDVSSETFFLKILQTYFPSATLSEISNAWCAAISVNEAEQQRFETLINEATLNKPVYLTANTNELDIKKLLSELFGAQLIEANLKSEGKDEIVEIKPHVFLCFSYRIGHFGTMQHIINKFYDSEDKIKIILAPNQERLKSILKKEAKINTLDFYDLYEYFSESHNIMNSKLKVS